MAGDPIGWLPAARFRRLGHDGSMGRPSRRPIAACLLAGLMAVAVISPTATLAQEPSTPAASGPIIDTSGWVRQVMPFLGYSVLLPPGFERVGDDPESPVPSSASIVDRDPQTGAALSAAAQRIADNGGLFDGLGMWSIDPTSLLQLGVLAGQPYRVSPVELRDIVEQTIAERASDMADPVMQATGAAAGNGFLAVYLDATDLAQHREIHLRTPTGRYLILASSYPGIAEPELEATVDAIAGSLRAIPGSAGDLPDPGRPADAPADPVLEATLPDHVGGVTLTRRSLSGESLVSSTETVTGSIAGELGRVVAAPGDVTVALAVPTDATAPLLIAAYRLAGVTPEQAQAFVDSFPREIWSDTRVAGHAARVSVVGDSGNRTWLRVAPGPNGDAVLYQVEAGKSSLGMAAIAALP
jgi:hypothetical protein